MRPASVTQSAAGTSAPLVLDPLGDNATVGLYAKITGSPTYSVEVTADNVFDPTVTPVWFPCLVPALTAATQNSNGLLQIPAVACRINQSGTGTVTLTAVVQGID